jgi:hypothetical protein
MRSFVVGFAVVALAQTCTSPEKAAPPAEPVADVAAPAELEAAPTPTPAPVAEPAPVPEATPAPAQLTDAEKKLLYVTVSQLNVRGGPSMQFEPVGVVGFGATVEPIATENMIWIKIGEGKFVSNKYLSETKPASPVDAVTNAAPAQANDTPAETQPAAATNAAPAADAPATEAPPDSAPATTP